MQSDEQSLGRLEENGYFMETRLKELDQLVAEQQTQLEALNKKVDQLQEAVAAIRAFLSDSGKGQDQTPPHHIARFW